MTPIGVTIPKFVLSPKLIVLGPKPIVLSQKAHEHPKPSILSKRLKTPWTP